MREGSQQFVVILALLDPRAALDAGRRRAFVTLSTGKAWPSNLEKHKASGNGHTAEWMRELRELGFAPEVVELERVGFAFRPERAFAIGRSRARGWRAKYVARGWEIVYGGPLPAAARALANGGDARRARTPKSLWPENLPKKPPRRLSESG